jgi:hypothetical protein
VLGGERNIPIFNRSQRRILLCLPYFCSIAELYDEEVQQAWIFIVAICFQREVAE